MKLSEIARHVGIDYLGEDREITRLATLDEADEQSLSFLDNPKYLKSLARTKAGAVLIKPEHVDALPKGTVALRDEEPYLKLALISRLFAPDLMRRNGADPIVGEGSRIGENVSLGRDVVIGRNVTILPGCYVGDGTVIGDETVLYANVTVYHGCEVGKRCILHAGSVIGSDGYGFAHTKTGEHVKLYQLGRVIIEDDVEIGANSTVDRGTLGNTVIRKGTKIDNLVHIAHNCDIGAHSLLVAQTGISGSTKMGRNTVMGGQSGTAGHLSIGDFATIAARGGVTKSLPGGKTYAGFPAVEIGLWRRINAAVMRLAKKGGKS